MPLTLGLVDHNTVRMAIVDDHLRASAADGFEQLVILGAGLDSRAWRLGELGNMAVFEVDHRASQAEKRERSATLPPKAARVEFVIEPGVRFRGQAGEQATMFLTDPSGNALEFKAFRDIEGQLFAR